MTPLGGQGHIAIPGPDQAALPQTRAGGDDGDAALVVGHPPVELDQAVARQGQRAIGGRLQVVEQLHVAHPEARGDLWWIDGPRQVDRLDRRMAHGSGHADDDALRALAAVVEKGLQELGHAGELRGDEAVFGHAGHPRVLGVEDPQIGLGAAYVAGQGQRTAHCRQFLSKRSSASRGPHEPAA